MDRYTMTVLVLGFALFGIFGGASALLYIVGLPGVAFCLKISIGSYVVAVLSFVYALGKVCFGESRMKRKYNDS